MPIAISPSEDVAFIGRPRNLVIDLTTGEILAEIQGGGGEVDGDIAIADLDTGLVALYLDNLIVFDYLKGQIIHRFERGGARIQLSGDGNRIGFKCRKVTYKVFQGVEK